MKRYTGNLVIELEDQNTGTIETVSETNMVTNAVNDILGVNPMGVMYKAGAASFFFQVPLRSRRITFICRQRICRWLMPVMMSMPRQIRRGAA